MMWAAAFVKVVDLANRGGDESSMRADLFVSHEMSKKWRQTTPPTVFIRQTERSQQHNKLLKFQRPFESKQKLLSFLSLRAIRIVLSDVNQLRNLRHNTRINLDPCHFAQVLAQQPCIQSDFLGVLTRNIIRDDVGTDVGRDKHE
jgi:hypothetical protein